MNDASGPLRDLKEQFDRFSNDFFERLSAEWPRERNDDDGIAAIHVDPWPSALFGGELAECGQKWIADLLAGREDAVVLTGHWLLVKAADDKQFPNLLRPLGEAFYRWNPRTKLLDDSLENTLVRALNDRARELGLRNSIQPVEPGDRFDAQRHNPLPGQHGMTIDAVLGWTVMRDDRVFAKATVSVK